MPSKIKFPVEATPGHVWCSDVFKGIVRYDINYRTHDSFAIFCYFWQQWFQPAFCTLAMGIKKRYYWSFNVFCTKKSEIWSLLVQKFVCLWGFFYEKTYLARIRPDLWPVLKTCTGTINFFTYSSSWSFKWSCSEASSTLDLRTY